MRGGAADKVMQWYPEGYELIRHGFCNLRNLTEEEIQKLDGYIVPADEGDIKYCENLKDHSKIILPKSGNRIINYDKYVPKDSTIYEILESGVLELNSYEYFEVLSLDEFKKLNFKNFNKVAIKTTTGSGSRGVWIIDDDRVHLGFKTTSQLTEDQYKNFIDFCESEGCKVMIQSLCPIDLLKSNCDFIIRDRKLVGYMWVETNQTQQFTNWDNGYFIHNEFTDKCMQEIVDLLINNGITDALMNFESYTDFATTNRIVEFNWRFSNSCFQSEAIGVNMVASYLEKKPFSFPYGRNYFYRYWRCCLENSVPDLFNHQGYKQ